MTFAETLNDLMRRYEIRPGALAAASGCSESTVERYRAGKREPLPDAPTITKLAAGFATLLPPDAPERDGGLTALLRAPLSGGLEVPYDAYLVNLRRLMQTFEIRSVSLARALAFDPSHISKILSGQRRPGDVQKFTDTVAAYAAERILAGGAAAEAAALLEKDPAALGEPRRLQEAIVRWLGSNSGKTSPSPLGGFLQKLDDFDLGQFLTGLRFADAALPQEPVRLPGVKHYAGLQEMMESELDFIRATVQAPETEDCILYSDMPMEDMAADPVFPKQWLLGMAALLQKGLRLRIVHDVHRPLGEMLLGLESYIPMYMTGQIDPYYLPRAEGGVFLHLLKVSGAAALTGSAVAGRQADGLYTLATDRALVQRARRQAARLLENALPLMEIFRADRRSAYAAAVSALPTDCPRALVCCAPPLWTAPPALLCELLREAGLPPAAIPEIEAVARRQRADRLTTMQTATLTLRVPAAEAFDFNAAPPLLPLADCFLPRDLPYTADGYRRHLAALRTLAEAMPNLTLRTEARPTFRNLSYEVVGSAVALVSKNTAPAIHFLIRHPKMVRALAELGPQITEEG